MPPPYPFPPSDLALGGRRARAMLLVMLGLPGSVYLYQGEELGLWEVETIADEDIQDPVWESSGHTIRGRDGCRVPIPWSGSVPPFGFSPPGVQPWLAQPASWADHTVTAESGREDSMLGFYREALALRKGLGAAGELSWLEVPDGVLAFDRGTFRCVLNLSDAQVPLPGPVILASAETVGDELPPDSAAWVVAG